MKNAMWVIWTMAAIIPSAISILAWAGMPAELAAENCVCIGVAWACSLVAVTR